MTLFDDALRFVLKWEGGYVNDPDDKGGATNKGITQRTYDSYRASLKKPYEDVATISYQEVSDIYLNRYWKPARCNVIKDSRLAVVVLDTAVNMGVGRAIKFLTDSKNDYQVYLQLREQKYREFAKVGNQKKFLQGWLNRIKDLKDYINKLK